MIDLRALDKILLGASREDLARIVWQASQYNSVLRKVANLHAAFLTLSNVEQLKEAIRDAATIDNFVSYKEADAYSQIVHEITLLLTRLYESGQTLIAVELALVAIECAECSAEDIQDGHYWEMALDDLRELVESWE